MQKYTKKHYRRFVQDMNQAGFDVEHYEGRFFWSGPAVRTDDLQQTLRATKVSCQWDNMGLSYIVYPKG